MRLPVSLSSMLTSVGPAGKAALRCSLHAACETLGARSGRGLDCWPTLTHASLVHAPHPRSHNDDDATGRAAERKSREKVAHGHARLRR